MNPYKLAFLVSHPIPYQAPLFRKLAERPEVDIMVYFCEKRGIGKDHDPEFGKKIDWDIPLLKGYRYKFLKGFLPRFLFLKDLYAGKYDAIIIHGWMNPLAWLALLCRTQIFLRSESPLRQELKKPKWKQFSKKIFFYFLFKPVKRFLYIGEENKKFYKFYGISAEKLFFTPYAVDNERFIRAFKALDGKKDELKKRLGISREKTVILFAGKLSKRKRPFDLLLAYEKIKNRNKALIFVGEGKLKNELENYVLQKRFKNVYFSGFKNQTEMPKYYAMADIFVLPSGMRETWGLVVNEAMCFKLPIIVSDLAGCGSDLVKVEENGYIFPVGNVNKLTFYLDDLIKREKKRREFGQRSFEIIQNYNYEKDIQGILKALKSIKQ